MRRFLVATATMLVVLGLAAGAAGWPAPARAGTTATLEVGTSSLCAYHTIEAAIAAANPGDRIKIENTLFVENPLVVGKNLTLAGSYNSAHPYSCLTQTGYAWTTVRRSGASAAPILLVQNATVNVTWITFENNGNGGGVAVTDGALNLENVIIQNNSATLGGGLRATRSAVSLADTEILDNSADEGGGIHAADHSSVIASSSTIRNNDGWDRGAGVYLSGASSLTAVAGTGIVHNRTMYGCDEGGGVYATGPGTQVLIDASQVISNTALLRGGGLYIGDEAVATIQNWSWIAENGSYGPAVSGGGGGAYVTGTGSTLNVFNCFFYENWADPEGGAIWNEFGTLNIDSAILISNQVAHDGGGIYTSYGPATVRGTYFADNKAFYGDGGAIATYRSALSAHRSYFVGNSSDGDGSAIFVQGANGLVEPEAEVVNCFLVDNSTTARSIQGPPATGSTFYVEGTAATLIHNTLAHETQQASFGVYVGGDSTVTMINNILTNFYVGIRRPSGGTGTASSSYDLFYGNQVDYDPTGVVVSHAVYGDPAFGGPGNYFLTATSAAIDTGTNAGVAIDYTGDGRPWGGGYDIGADEYPDRMRTLLPLVVSGH